MAAYSDGFTKRSGIATKIEVAADLGRLEPDIETALFRVVQECLLNIHRHSGSATAHVILSRQDGNLKLQVSDAGMGMNLAKDSDPAGLGVGLLGIRERIRQLEGHLEIASGQGQGTTVVATVPYRPRKECPISASLSMDSSAVA